MATLTKHIYRLSFDFGTKQSKWTESKTGRVLQPPEGVEMQFEIGIIESLSPFLFYDASEITSITMEVKNCPSGSTAPSASDPTLMAQTANVIDNAILTESSWNAGTSQHATFMFNSSETNIGAGTKWLVFTALTTAGLVSLAYGKFEVIEDGSGPNTPVTPLGPTYYTQTQVDNLVATKQNALTPASQAEMEAGTETALRSMAPVNVAQAITALSGGSGSGEVSSRDLTKSKMVPSAIALRSKLWGIKNNSETPRVSILAIGDSLTNRPGVAADELIRELYPSDPANSAYGPGFAGGGATLSGGATIIDKTEYDLNWIGTYFNLPAGGQVVFAARSSRILRIPYVTTAGGGALRVQVNGVDEPGYTAIDTSAGGEGLVVIELDKTTVASRSVTLISDSGTCKVFAPMWDFAEADGDAVGYYPLGSSSWAPGDYSAANSRMATLIEELQADIVTFMADDANNNDKWANFLPNVKIAIDAVTTSRGYPPLVLIFGSMTGGVQDYTAASDFIANYCKNEGWLFVDAFAYAGEDWSIFAAATAWENDNTHYLQDAQTDILRQAFFQIGLFNYKVDGGGSGDMLAATYDPNAVNADAFDADNHDVDLTPVNYSAATPDVEAHLAGVDDALGSVGGGGASIATKEEVADLTDNTKAISPESALIVAVNPTSYDVLNYPNWIFVGDAGFDNTYGNMLKAESAGTGGTEASFTSQHNIPFTLSNGNVYNQFRNNRKYAIGCAWTTRQATATGVCSLVIGNFDTGTKLFTSTSGVGWRLDNLTLYGITYDGTTHQELLLGTTVAALSSGNANIRPYALTVFCDGSGNFTFYFDGTEIGTIAGPTGSINTAKIEGKAFEGTDAAKQEFGVLTMNFAHAPQ